MKTPTSVSVSLILASALTFSAGAFAQDGPGVPDGMPATSPVVAAPTPAVTAPAAIIPPAAAPMAKWTEKEKMFAKKAAAGNLAEVKLGELAAAKSGSDEVKTFGQQMVTDHGKANTDLEAVLTKKNMPFEPKLDAKQQKTYDKMSALSGAAFDKAYTADMLEDHKMDVAEYKEAIKTTKDEDLKGYQTATLPVVEHHLEMLKGMKKTDHAAAKKS